MLKTMTIILRSWISVILGILLAITIYTSTSSILFAAAHQVRDFIASHAHYEELRKTLPTFDSAREAENFIPSDAAIDFSPSRWNIHRVAARYSLYPREVAEHWDYFIDFDRSVQNPNPAWQIYYLSTGVPIYAKAGHAFLSHPAVSSNDNPPPYNFLIFILITFYQSLL